MSPHQKVEVGVDFVIEADEDCVDGIRIPLSAMICRLVQAHRLIPEEFRPTGVILINGHEARADISVIYERDSTEEEILAREEAGKRWALRYEVQERKELARLMAKYGRRAPAK